MNPRRLIQALFAAACLGLAVVSLMRFVSFDNPWLHLFVPLAPAGLALSLLAFFASASGAVRPLGLVGVLLAALLALPGPVLPRTGCNSRTASANAVTVFSHNASYEAFDAEQVAAEVDQSGADIVLLQEADPVMTDALNAAVASPFAHVVSGAGDKTLSLSVLSRWPVTDVVDSVIGDDALLSDRWTDEVNPMLFVSVETTLGPLRLANVHLSAPRSAELVQRRRIEVPVVVDQLVAWDQTDDSSLPDLMMGDFNASTSHADLRSLMGEAGYADGHRLAGCGLGTTWSPLVTGPGVLALDHALVRADPEDRRFAVSTFRSHGYAGSDHRAISVILEPQSE